MPSFFVIVGVFAKCGVNYAAAIGVRVEKRLNVWLNKVEILVSGAGIG